MDKLTDEEARARARAKTETNIKKLEERVSQLGELEAGYHDLISRTEQNMVELKADMARAAANWVSDQARRAGDDEDDGEGASDGRRGPIGQEQRLYFLEEAKTRKSEQEHELRRVLMRRKDTKDALEQARLILAMENANIGDAKK